MWGCLAIRRALDGLRLKVSLRGLEKLGNAKTKHGEVSFPTQVRYGVVFIIGPFFVI
jgi:phenylpropionate dioxygenase-like ring-hydroxylating dioxygenase large terminal subunit